MGRRVGGGGGKRQKQALRYTMRQGRDPASAQTPSDNNRSFTELHTEESTPLQSYLRLVEVEEKLETWR